MSSRPSLFDLFGSTSLLNLEGRIAEGKIPTATNWPPRWRRIREAIAGMVFRIGRVKPAW